MSGDLRYTKLEVQCVWLLYNILSLHSVALSNHPFFQDRCSQECKSLIVHGTVIEVVTAIRLGYI